MKLETMTSNRRGLIIGTGILATGLAGSAFAYGSMIDGVEIVALCDEIRDRVDKMQLLLKQKGFAKAKSFLGSKNSARKDKKLLLIKDKSGVNDALKIKVH